MNLRRTLFGVVSFFPMLAACDGGATTGGGGTGGTGGAIHPVTDQRPGHRHSELHRGLRQDHPLALQQHGSGLRRAHPGALTGAT